MTPEFCTKLDNSIARLLKVLGPFTMQAPKSAALATMMGLILPSHLYAAVSATETVVALNIPGQLQSITCSAIPARARKQPAFLTTPVKSPAHANSLVRSLVSLRKVGVYLRHFPTDFPPSVHPPAVNSVFTVGGAQSSFRSFPAEPFDAVPHASRAVEVFSDASRSDTGRSTAGHVVVTDAWDDRAFFHHFPPASLNRHATASDIPSSCVSCLTPSSTFGETLAIACALRCQPLSTPISIVSDSKSAIAAVKHHCAKPRIDRSLIRAPCRAPLLMARAVLSARRIKGVATNFTHVKAHTLSDDHRSCGNRAADALVSTALSTNSAPPFAQYVAEADCSYQLWTGPHSTVNLRADALSSHVVSDPRLAV